MATQLDKLYQNANSILFFFRGFQKCHNFHKQLITCNNSFIIKVKNLKIYPLQPMCKRIEEQRPPV